MPAGKINSSHLNNQQNLTSCSFYDHFMVFVFGFFISRADHYRMRLLLLFIDEPIPGNVLPELAREIGDIKSSHYYKAMLEVMLRQLQGLENCRIRFCYSPLDAGDATKFWLLPKMSATACETDNVYVTSNAQLKGPQRQEIDFRPQGEGSIAQRLKRAFSEGFSDGYTAIATVDPTCIECGARWINASFAQFHKQTSRDTLIGPGTRGNSYMIALKSQASELFQEIRQTNQDFMSISESKAQQTGRNIELLPPLSTMSSLSDWQRLLDTPLGPALKKALGEPTH